MRVLVTYAPRRERVGLPGSLGLVRLDGRELGGELAVLAHFRNELNAATLRLTVAVLARPDRPPLSSTSFFQATTSRFERSASRGSSPSCWPRYQPANAMRSSR